MENNRTTIDEITQLLGSTNLPPSGVSFSNRCLNINTADDAKEIIAAMETCGECMEFLNLEGNTLGVEGAKAVAEQLQKHSKIKKAIWRDMFTGRNKTEIPNALVALSNGLMRAKAELEVLELSDNASGPIGVDGIKDLISSPACYTLKELRLNNMGLGTTGGKMLATALIECHNNSVRAGKPLALKVFIAGRNRLENEGARALAQVFKIIGTLEEVQMPQNGISAATELLKGLSLNLNLRYLNLNDNTLGKCVPALSSLLVKLPNLVHLDVGDCLLQNDGALKLAAAFKDGHEKIEEVCLSGNEIKLNGGIAVINSLITKPKIRCIKLGENEIDKSDVALIRKEAEKYNKQDVIDICDDKEGENEENEDEEGDYDYDEECEETEEEEEEIDDENVDEEYENDSYYEDRVESDESQGSYDQSNDYQNITTQDFSSCLRRNLVEETNELKIEPFVLESSLSLEKIDGIINKVKSQADVNKQLEALLSVIMMISTNYKSAGEEKKPTIEDYTMKLYKELFELGVSYNQINNINNLLPAYVGIIKNEDKKPLVKFFDRDSSLKLLKSAMTKDFFPISTRDVVNFIFKQKGLTKQSDS